MKIFGITKAGFVIKPQRQILAELEQAELAEMDPALDVSSDQPIGQLNGILSRAISELWELGQVVYNTFDRDKAEGASLESLSKLTGTTKDPARYATVPMTLVFSSPASLTPGVNFVQLDTDPTVRVTPVLPFTAAAAGTYTNVTFRAETAGLFTAANTHLNAIATPVVGWDSAVNTAEATGGFPADNDIVLRTKMAIDVAATGTSTTDAIRDAVLAIRSTDPAFTTIQSVATFENVSDRVDADGLPPFSFQVLVFDGDSPGAPNDDLIAQAIWDAKPAGIRSFGSLSGTAVDALGIKQTVSFERVTRVPIFLTYQLATDGSYGGDAAFSAFIADFANAAYAASGVGTGVFAARAIAVAFFVPGVTDVKSLFLGTAPSPSGIVNIPIGERELARFDSSRVVVVP